MVGRLLDASYHETSESGTPTPRQSEPTSDDDGTFRYAHDGSETTTDAFTVAASDGGAASDPVVVAIAIAPVSDAPTLGAVTLVVAEGAYVEATADGAASLISTASDLEGDSLAVAPPTPPTHGTLVLEPDGTFRYTHDGSETTEDEEAVNCQQLRRSREPLREGPARDPKGRRAGWDRGARDHPWVDGGAVVYRVREGEPGQLLLVLARGGARALADRGEKAVHDGGPDRCDRRDRVPPGSSAARTKASSTRSRWLTRTSTP